MSSIWEDIQKIVVDLTKPYLSEASNKVYCIDVSLRPSAAVAIDTATRSELHNVLRASLPTVSSLESAVSLSRDSSSSNRYFFVSDPKLGQFVVGPEYHSLRQRVISAAKQFSSPNTYIEPSSLSSTDSSSAPLESKLVQLAKLLGDTPIYSSIVANVASKLSSEHSVSTTYQYNRPDFDLDGFKGALGKGTVLVTLQGPQRSTKMLELSSKVSSELKTYFTSDTFKHKLLTQKGSNSILEDTKDALVAAISGKPLPAGSKHAKKPTTTRRQGVLGNPINTIKVFTNAKGASILRTEMGYSYGLSSLLQFLNDHLHNTVSANMGNGTRRDILNYRTGRFATSTHVDRLTISKQGMITAFYSYMKSPYATFSAGGKQEYPKSRDPKLLIARSIREIAAEKVTNRLRAVVV